MDCDIPKTHNIRPGNLRMPISKCSWYSVGCFTYNDQLLENSTPAQIVAMELVVFNVLTEIFN